MRVGTSVVLGRRSLSRIRDDLFDANAYVTGELSEKRWSDVARVERDGGASTVLAPILAMRSPLPS